MAKTLLITHPRHDTITSYLYDFSQSVIQTLKAGGGVHIALLEQNAVTRERFEFTVSKEEPQMIFLNGHGARDCVAGFRDEIILDKHNVSLMKGRIVYALACDSLAELGRMAVEAGSRAYIGYFAEFMLVHDPSREATPSKDRNALPFRQACVTMLNSLVFGNTVEEAILKTKQKYQQLIQSYGTSADDPFGDMPLIRFALAWNLEFLEMEGDPSATF